MCDTVRILVQYINEITDKIGRHLSLLKVIVDILSMQFTNGQPNPRNVGKGEGNGCTSNDESDVVVVVVVVKRSLVVGIL